MIQLLQPRVEKVDALSLPDPYLHQVCEDLFPSTTAGGRTALAMAKSVEQGHHPWNEGFQWMSWENLGNYLGKIWEHALHLGF